MLLLEPDSGQIVDCNPRVVELFEAEAGSNLIGLADHTRHVRPFTATEVKSNLTQIHSRGFWTMEIEYQTLKGNRFWGNIAPKPITIADHLHTFGRIMDISQWKQVVLDLEWSNFRFGTIFNQADLGLAKQAEQDRVFAEIINDIHRSLHLHLILDSAVENIRHLLSADRVLVLRILPNNQAKTRPSRSKMASGLSTL